MKIRYKALMQAVQFACLPTISLLLLLFFGFFSIEKTITFITSDSSMAISLRVLLLLLEFGLIATLYSSYSKKEEDIELKKALKHSIDNSEELDFKARSSTTEFHHLGAKWYSKDSYYAAQIDEDHILIRHKASGS